MTGTGRTGCQSKNSFTFELDHTLLFSWSVRQSVSQSVSQSISVIWYVLLKLNDWKTCLVAPNIRCVPGHRYRVNFSGAVVYLCACVCDCVFMSFSLSLVFAAPLYRSFWLRICVCALFSLIFISEKSNIPLTLNWLNLEDKSKYNLSPTGSSKRTSLLSQQMIIK